MKEESITVKTVTKNYPENDFITQKFDSLTLDALEKVRIIFSTPRSGSTYLCSKIHENCGIVGHEYFHASGYIQYLAKRWKCYENSMINKEDYWNNLVKYRSFDRTLIINLHGSHLQLFYKFINKIKSLDVLCIHLIRGDILEQSVSYAVAKKTAKWTKYYNHLNGEDNLVISNEELFQAAKAINGQNLKINAFIHKHKLNSQPILYENIIRDKDIRRVIDNLGLKINKSASITFDKLSLTKQSSPKKSLLIDQFSKAI